MGTDCIDKNEFSGSDELTADNEKRPEHAKVETTADTVRIPRALLQEIASKIGDQMYHYHHNWDGSDYSCLFCYEEARPYDNQYGIVHREDCDGDRWLNELYAAASASEPGNEVK